MYVKELRNDLRMVLARLLEKYPNYITVTGVFSALKDKQLKWSFSGAGEAKVQERFKLPQREFYAAMLPALVKEFEEKQHVAPAFIMEWIITGEISRFGTIALAEVMSKQAEAESVLHDTAPQDIRDLDIVTQPVICPVRSEENRK